MIHLAALPSVPRSIQDPLTTNAVNAAGTRSVVPAARDAGTQRVVFASSSSVYGRAQELPKTEKLLPQPISPYGVSKLAAEQYCMKLRAHATNEPVTERRHLAKQDRRAWLGLPVRLRKRREHDIALGHGLRSAMVYSGSSSP